MFGLSIALLYKGNSIASSWKIKSNTFVAVSIWTVEYPLLPDMADVDDANDIIENTDAIEAAYEDDCDMLSG